MTAYVLGFAFGRKYALPKGLTSRDVLLIRKVRPSWQAGFLNGIGGHIEYEEAPREAMIREFQEETGMETEPEDWDLYAILHGPDYTCHVYRAFDLPIIEARQTTDETLERHSMAHLPPDVLPSVTYLAPMALDLNIVLTADLYYD